MGSPTDHAVLRAEQVQLGYWAPGGFTLAVQDATFSVSQREKARVRRSRDQVLAKNTKNVTAVAG